MKIHIVKVFWIRPMLLSCLLFIIQSCSKDQPAPIDTTNKIKILSVTPTSGLTDGQQVNFTVTVSYNLYSKKTGTLMIGFNNGQTVNAAVMLTDADKIISSGIGQHAFNVLATVKNWGTQGDFYVYVNLSEDPIPNSSWTPFANDYHTLIPKQ